MELSKKEVIVLHSGGMDSSICLALAVQKFGKEHVLSLGFDYEQRHSSELEAAATISQYFGVQRYVMPLAPMIGWGSSSLVNSSMKIGFDGTAMPNSFVPGRNGLFLLLASTIAYKTDASCIYIGVMELEGANSGYPDCSSVYIKAVESVIRMDLQNPSFAICAPLIHLTKKETLCVAAECKVLGFLLQNTVTCYEGIPSTGCQKCPACLLRAEGLALFYKTGLEDFSKSFPLKTISESML